MKKKTLIILIASALGVVILAGLAIGATLFLAPSNQFNIALNGTGKSFTAAMQGMAGANTNQLLLTNSHEQEAVLTLSQLTVPGMNEASAGMIKGMQIKLGTRYDNATANGAAELQLLNGGNPALTAGIYLKGGEIAVQSKELLDKTLVYKIESKLLQNATLQARLASLQNADSAKSSLDSAAKLLTLQTYLKKYYDKMFKSVPGSCFTTGQKEITLLGKATSCSAVRLTLEGETLSKVMIPLLKEMAADEGFKQALKDVAGSSLPEGNSIDELFAGVNEEIGTLEADLKDAKLTWTILRSGFTVVSHTMTLQKGEDSLEASVLAYAKDKQFDLQSSVKTPDGVDMALSLLKAAAGQDKYDITGKFSLTGETPYSLTLTGSQTDTDGATKGDYTLDVMSGSQSVALLKLSLDSKTIKPNRDFEDNSTINLTIPDASVSLDLALAHKLSIAPTVDTKLPTWTDADAQHISSDFRELPDILASVEGKLGGLSGLLGGQ